MKNNYGLLKTFFSTNLSTNKQEIELFFNNEINDCFSNIQLFGFLIQNLNSIILNIKKIMEKIEKQLKDSEAEFTKVLNSNKEKEMILLFQYSIYSESISKKYVNFINIY